MTTIIEQSTKSKKGGYTLIEIIIVMGISMLVIFMGLSAVSFISQSNLSLSNYVRMNTEGRNALEIISRDLRMGHDVNAASSNHFDFDLYGKNNTNVNVIYQFDSLTNSISRTENGITQEFLANVEEFNFNYFNLRRESTTELISIKEVQMEAVMKKKSLSLNNTNHIISARFMMRNKAVGD